MEDEKLNQIAFLIKFVLIKDNNGKTIYSRYYNCGLDDPKTQKDFERRLCITTQNVNVAKDEIDIFSINTFNVICKIGGEIALFIGINENENECLASNFFVIFENVLSTLLNDKFTKENVMSNFDKVIVLIDEMINEGVVMNTDGENLEKNINLRSENVNSNNFISFGDSGSSSHSSSLFGSLLSGARTIFGS